MIIGLTLPLAGAYSADRTGAEPAESGAGGPSSADVVTESDPRDIEDAGRRFVEAVNTGDALRRQETARAVFSGAVVREQGVERLAGLMERVATSLGRLEFHHAELMRLRIGDSELRSLHVFARASRDGGWKDLQFRLEEEPPYRLESLAFVADVAEPVYLPPGEITDPAVLQWLSSYVDRLAADDDLSGALLIAQGDRPIVEHYFGHADSARSVPCATETRFNLGSGSKMFTALALAGLVEEGRLRFSDPVDKFLPSYPDKAWSRKATVGNLLSHTSGLAEYWTRKTDTALRGVTSLRDLLPFVEAAGVDFAPGADAVYSNSNFILAGLIIESVTDKDYHDVVRDRVLDRAGMRETLTTTREGAEPGLAQPLTGNPRAWRVAARGPRGTSAGGGYSTARDMLRFGRALVAGRVVSREMLAELTGPHTAQIPNARLDYGYGFIRETNAGGLLSYGHGGFAAGVNFEFRYFPASDITLIVFSNQDNGAYDSLRKTATRLITGER